LKPDGKEATAYFDGLSMDSVPAPRVEPGAVLQFAGQSAKSVVAGRVAKSSAGRLELSGDGDVAKALAIEPRRIKPEGRSGKAYADPLERDVIEQLVPGDLVELGWYESPAGKHLAWLKLVGQFPRKGRLSGKCKAWDQAAGTLTIEIVAAPQGGERMVGKDFPLLLKLTPEGKPDPEQLRLAARLRPGDPVEAEYQKRPGDAPRALALSSSVPEPPVPKPEPKKPEPPGEKEPD
jgi:hypothetical protein